jgi:hypothetical protein
MFWLPLIGPILQGLFSTATTIYGKFKDTEVAIRTADTEDAKIASQIIRDTNDDICLRIIRDFALLPPVVWSSIIGWDTIVASRYPDLMFHVPNYPDAVQYIPYGAFAFLFGVLGMQIWKRK